MKKIIILITLIANFGFCDVIVKVYNKTTGQTVAMYNNKQCSNRLVVETNVLRYEIRNDEVVEITNASMWKNNFHDFMISCDKKSKNHDIFSSYNTSMFAYSIERIEMSLK
jgi:hypothetical protein